MQADLQCFETVCLSSVCSYRQTEMQAGCNWWANCWVSAPKLSRWCPHTGILITWTMERRASMPSRWDPLGFTGTPTTGKGVIEATIPGKWAAPPAPAIITCKMNGDLLWYLADRRQKEVESFAKPSLLRWLPFKTECPRFLLPGAFLCTVWGWFKGLLKKSAAWKCKKINWWP